MYINNREAAFKSLIDTKYKKKYYYIIKEYYDNVTVTNINVIKKKKFTSFIKKKYYRKIHNTYVHDGIIIIY